MSGGGACQGVSKGESSRVENWGGQADGGRASIACCSSTAGSTQSRKKYHRSIQQPYLKLLELLQAVHALVLVLAADEAAKRIHKAGPARTLLQVPCGSDRGGGGGTRAHEVSAGVEGWRQRSCAAAERALGPPPRHSGGARGPTHSPRQGHASACSIFFSMSCSPSAKASASAIAPFIAA